METTTKQLSVPELRFSEFEGYWFSNMLEDAIEVIMGQSPDSKSYNDCANGEYLIQGNADMFNRLTSPRQWTSEPTKICEEGDLILTVRAPVGAIGKSIHRACIGRGVCALKPKNGFDKNFIYQFLLQYESKWKRIEQGSTFTAISGSDIKKLKLNTPQLPEQQKIASFLTQVDDKIAQLTKKKELLEQYKKGVMQKIFTQEIRFKDDNGNDFPKWEKKKLGEVFEERSEKGFEDMELLSVSIQNGIYPQNEGSKTDNSSKNKSNYKRVLKNDIAYNSMRMWQGASAVSKYDGIVSPAYTVLKGNNRNDSHFFGELFKMTFMIQTFQKHSQGLTSDTWNLKYKGLSKINVFVACHEEQTKIANFLKSIDKKIEQVNTQLTQAQTWKKGLLQKMFV